MHLEAFTPLLYLTPTRHIWLILCALNDLTSVGQNIQGIITSVSALAPLHTIVAKQLHPIDMTKPEYTDKQAYETKACLTLMSVADL